MSKPRTKLTLKQHKFVEEYIKNGGNATQAVIDAGYRCANKVVAQAIGSENLFKPLVNNAIELRKAEISEKTDISVASCQSKLWDIAEQQKEKRPAVSVAALNSVLKTIGGFMGERPTPESIAAKTLDLALVREISEIGTAYLQRRYNGIEPNCTEYSNTLTSNGQNSEIINIEPTIPGE